MGAEPDSYLYVSGRLHRLFVETVMQQINNPDNYILANSITKASIGDVIVDGVGVLKPLQDITPMESLQISILLAVAVANRFNYLDFKGHIEKHNLGRHFTNE